MTQDLPPSSPRMFPIEIDNRLLSPESDSSGSKHHGTQHTSSAQSPTPSPPRLFQHRQPQYSPPNSPPPPSAQSGLPPSSPPPDPSQHVTPGVRPQEPPPSAQPGPPLYSPPVPPRSSAPDAPPPPSSQARPPTTTKPPTPRIDDNITFSRTQLYHDEARQQALITNRRYIRERVEHGWLLSMSDLENYPLEEPIVSGALDDEDERCEICHHEPGEKEGCVGQYEGVEMEMDGYGYEHGGGVMMRP